MDSEAIKAMYEAEIGELQKLIDMQNSAHMNILRDMLTDLEEGEIDEVIEQLKELTE